MTKQSTIFALGKLVIVNDCDDADSLEAMCEVSSPDVTAVPV